MGMSDNNNINLNEELEFNNGFGDALREKESYTFSWKKQVLSWALV